MDYPDQRAVPLEENYKLYCETLLSVDDSVGRVLAQLERQGMLDSTLVLYLGDNGYQWGEHGLQDKRTAYEESMRIPMIAMCPDLIKGGAKTSGMVLNMDIAPTMLEAPAAKHRRTCRAAVS